MAYEKVDGRLLRQLALGLDVEEMPQPGSGYVSPDEAARRSAAARQALELKGATTEAPAWLDNYLRLLDLGWPWRVACYIAWAASPKRERWPKTQEMLATEVLGLTGARQIATWRERNPTIDQTIAIMQAAPLMDHRADIYAALATAASDADHRNNPDRKLALEILGDYVPRQKVDMRRSDDVEDLSQMSEEELARLAGKIARGDEKA